MSQTHKYNIDVHGISRADAEKAIEKIDYEIDGYNYDEKAGILHAYGRDTFRACDDADKHNGVKDELTAAGIQFTRVETRWRCTEFDTWDSQLNE